MASWLGKPVDAPAVFVLAANADVPALCCLRALSGCDGSCRTSKVTPPTTWTVPELDLGSFVLGED